MKRIRFAPRELDVMQALWELDGGTVAEVRERLPDPLAYNTVLTILKILEEKGHVGREEQGRAHRYFALVGEDAARSSAVGRLLGELFDGSPSLLLTHLIASPGVDEAELKRLRALLDDSLATEPEDDR